MTISELIKALQEYDPDTQVVFRLEYVDTGEELPIIIQEMTEGNKLLLAVGEWDQ